MELGLKGKTALVTGASEGIGSAVARKLADEGVRVAICARTESKLKDWAGWTSSSTTPGPRPSGRSSISRTRPSSTTQQAVPLHTPGSACNAALRMFTVVGIVLLLVAQAEPAYSIQFLVRADLLFHSPTAQSTRTIIQFSPGSARVLLALLAPVVWDLYRKRHGHIHTS